jgi:hypothetical protein
MPNRAAKPTRVDSDTTGARKAPLPDTREAVEELRLASVPVGRSEGTVVQRGLDDLAVGSERLFLTPEDVVVLAVLLLERALHPQEDHVGVPHELEISDVPLRLGFPHGDDPEEEGAD